MASLHLTRLGANGGVAMDQWLSPHALAEGRVSEDHVGAAGGNGRAITYDRLPRRVRRGYTVLHRLEVAAEDRRGGVLDAERRQRSHKTVKEALAGKEGQPDMSAGGRLQAMDADGIESPGMDQGAWPG